MCNSSLFHERKLSILGTPKEYLCLIKPKVGHLRDWVFLCQTCESVSMDCGMSKLCVLRLVLFTMLMCELLHL